MDPKVDLIPITASKHMPQGELDQLLVDRNSLNASIMGDNQKGAHGMVIAGDTNAMTYEKIKAHRGWKIELRII